MAHPGGRASCITVVATLIAMEMLPAAFASGWASGINAWGTVLVLGVLGRFAGFRITVLDERPEFASRERFPEADEIVCAPPAAALETLGIKAQSAIVIATAGFEQDFAVARAALRSDAGFIGMIGSRRKREVLARTLAEEGFEPAAIERIRMPVGLEIHAETPQEIAVSVVAQLIAFRRCRSA